MARSSYGTGTIFKRGNIWYVSYWVDGKQVQKSSGSANIQDAKRLRHLPPEGELPFGGW